MVWYGMVWYGMGVRTHEACNNKYVYFSNNNTKRHTTINHTNCHLVLIMPPQTRGTFPYNVLYNAQSHFDIIGCEHDMSIISPSYATASTRRQIHFIQISREELSNQTSRADSTNCIHYNYVRAAMNLSKHCSHFLFVVTNGTDQLTRCIIGVTEELRNVLHLFKKMCFTSQHHSGRGGRVG